MDHHNIRKWLEEREEGLSPYAAKSRRAHRDRPEEPSPMRTEFQRDRDRIIHSKAFRRLKHKTQVFIAPPGDHYATRLTHTLEVSQIARTIARALNLNEDLAEAISLGHDLGHTPFGHVGEDVLNEIYPGGFSHNVQSVRVVEVLEKEGEGLNLTREVREGMLKHSKSREGILGANWETPNTLEGQICKIADTIAYINHDIADALRAGLITADDLPQSSIAVLGDSHSARINSLVSDVVEHSWAPMISMSHAVLAAMNALRDFLFERVYEVRAMKEESERARGVVRSLYYYFIRNPHELPGEFIRMGHKRAGSRESEGKESGGEGDSGLGTLDSELPDRGVVDYIAGMTDQFALSMFEVKGFKACPERSRRVQR